MSHFRLWRRMRRLAGHLSCYLSCLFATLSAPPISLFRAVLPHHAASGWDEGFRQRISLSRLYPSRKRSLPGHRSYPAFIGILIALSIEFCGCDLARDSVLSLESRGGEIGNQIIPRAALPLPHLSFYDPSYDPSDPARKIPSASLADGELLLPVQTVRLEAKPLPWAIPESVYFVYKTGAHGAHAPVRKPLATAFVISVPGRGGHRRFVRFLVTARHVVDPEWAHCPGKNPVSIDLRLNRRSGGVGYETISLLSERKRRFFTPADSTADLAVIPLDEGLIANLDEYKFIDVPFRLLPTDSETLQFHVEQTVMTARVLPWPSGESSSYPVFDAGVLTKMPAEAVAVQCGVAEEPLPDAKPLHIWFINAGTPQGASGAPVYTAIARGTGIAKTPVLLGIQSVACPEQGVAGITPSTVLRDLIQTVLRGEKASMNFYKGPDPWPQNAAPSLY